MPGQWHMMRRTDKMQVTFTVSTEQAVEMCAFYDKLQNQAMEEIQIASDEYIKKCKERKHTDFNDEIPF